jgi:hypothetical protein
MHRSAHSLHLFARDTIQGNHGGGVELGVRGGPATYTPCKFFPVISPINTVVLTVTGPAHFHDKSTLSFSK